MKDLLPKSTSTRARRLLERIGSGGMDHHVISADGKRWDKAAVADLIKTGNIRRYRLAGRRTVDELHVLCGLPVAPVPDNSNVRLLKQLDGYLSGVVEYEHGWINPPTKPELTPKQVVAELIRRLS